MTLIRKIKNYIGDKHGICRCPITGETSWKTDKLLIPVAEKRYVMVNSEALDKYGVKGLAEKIAQEKEFTDDISVNLYSVDDIISHCDEWELLYKDGNIAYLKECSELADKLDENKE